MKKLGAGHIALCMAGFVGLLAIFASAAHPFGMPKLAETKRFDVPKPPVPELKIPSQVAAVLRRSCMDCHSNQTVWPWYSYVAPLSWMIEKDVHAGRDHLNLSDWAHYTFDQRQDLLAGVATAVRNRKMPLPQYLAIHRHARLSDAETDILYRWARSERRRLRAAR